MKNNYIYIAIGVLFFLLFSEKTQAQQLPLFTQYREYHSFINPATVNSDYFIIGGYNINVGISSRSQWVDKDKFSPTKFNAPTTYFLKGEYVFTTKRAGLVTGGYVIKDQTGPTSFTGFYGRIGGIISDDIESRGLSIGINIGAVQYDLKTSNLDFLQLGDPLVMDYSQIYPDVGAGIFFYTDISGKPYTNYFYAGFSVPQIMSLDLEFQDIINDLPRVYNIERTPHFFGLLGFYKTLSTLSVWETSIWFKSVEGAPINLDFNTRFQWETNFWLGVGYSTTNTLHLETGFMVGDNIGWDNSNFKIGYGFDHTFGDIGGAFGYSHELNISMNIAK